ncbi:LamB/YcsF family protein [Cronobacter sakazakii]|uniref:LamB/YcsF family protein n=1 Tax=Cronobacter sakazakii TaxID=28141 RepID=UPI00387B6640
MRAARVMSSPRARSLRRSRYLADGALVPRSEPGALIEDDDEAVSRTLMMVQEGRVRSRDGAWAAVNAQTVCLHGDGTHALAFARRLREAFDARQIQVSA